MIPLFKVLMSEEVLAPLSRTLYSGYVGQGPKVEEFEKNLREYFQSSHVLTLVNGTAGLHLALRLIGIKGKEIITTPMTCTATNWPIIINGGIPVWCDIQPDTGNIDPSKIWKLINDKTAAILVVHWGGMPCDIEEVNEIAERFHIPVIEDAAHAFGAYYKDRPLGSHSDYVMFSFQAIKHLTTVDGGALCIKDRVQYQRGKLLRWYGINREGSRKDFRCEEDIEEVGDKLHMNDLAATIGLVNLKSVGLALQIHRDNASYYNQNLKNVPGLTLVKHPIDRLSSYWIYTILVEHRDDFFRKMNAEDIMVSRVHERNDKHSCVRLIRRDLPGVDEFVSRMICIPVGWWVSNSDREYIVRTIKKGW